MNCPRVIDLLENYLEFIRSTEDKYDFKPLVLATLCFFLFFPFKREDYFKDKNCFLNFLYTNNKISWFLEYFGVEINKQEKKYLQEKNEWFYCLKSLTRDNATYYDISRIYELLKVRETRKKTGVFFSNQKQIDLTCKLTLFSFIKDKTKETPYNELLELIFRNKSITALSKRSQKEITELLQNIRIIDPSCGTGLFIIEILNIFKKYVDLVKTDTFGNFYGLDIDRDSIQLAKLFFFHAASDSKVEFELKSKFRKITQNIRVDDFLKKNLPLKSYDLVIGNPPYVRHHVMSAQYKNRLSTEYSTFVSQHLGKLTTKIDKKSDLFIYFILKSILILKQGGSLGLIVSRAWVSSRYAKALNEVLTNYFNLEFILESPKDFWLDAAIKTHILVGTSYQRRRDCKETDLIVSKEALRDLSDKVLTKSLEKNAKGKSYYFNDRIKVNLYEDDSLRISRVENITNLLAKNKSNFPILRFDYLLAPKVLLMLLSSNINYFCRLKDLGEVQMGSTTGANKYFYLNADNVKVLGIDDKYLHKMTKSPKEWITLESINRESGLFLLTVREDISNTIIPTNVFQYLEKIRPKLFSRPYFRNKTEKNWYTIPLIIPQFIIPNMTFKRTFVALNKEKYHIDKQFIGFTFSDNVSNEKLYAFLAIFNSTLCILLREIQGTRTLGLGSLKISTLEARNLIVLNPNKIANEILKKLSEFGKKLAKEKIPDFSRLDKSKYKLIQQEIDKILVCDILGYNDNILNSLRESFEFEISSRLLKGESDGKKSCIS